MAAELTEHLGDEHGQAPPGGTGNSRNGITPKTIQTKHGSVLIESRSNDFCQDWVLAVAVLSQVSRSWAAWSSLPGRRWP